MRSLKGAVLVHSHHLREATASSRERGRRRSTRTPRWTICCARRARRSRRPTGSRSTRRRPAFRRATAAAGVYSTTCPVAGGATHACRRKKSGSVGRRLTGSHLAGQGSGFLLALALTHEGGQGSYAPPWLAFARRFVC